MDDEELTPCPFCGGHTVLERSEYGVVVYFVQCLDCNATGPDFFIADMAIAMYTTVAQVMEWCRSVPHEVYEDFANAGADSANSANSAYLAESA